MSRRWWGTTLALLVAVGLALPGEARRKKEGEPDRVVVQHVLISFKGAARSKNKERSRKEARALAESLVQRARDGGDFDALVKEYTDDRYPGIYTMTNWGTLAGGSEYDRDGMAPAFGDVSFSLGVGEIGLADYHAALSPYGYHVIRRIE